MEGGRGVKNSSISRYVIYEQPLISLIIFRREKYIWFFTLLLGTSALYASRTTMPLVLPFSQTLFLSLHVKLNYNTEGPQFQIVGRMEVNLGLRIVEENWGNNRVPFQAIVENCTCFLFLRYFALFTQATKFFLNTCFIFKLGV